MYFTWLCTLLCGFLQFTLFWVFRTVLLWKNLTTGKHVELFQGDDFVTIWLLSYKSKESNAWCAKKILHYLCFLTNNFKWAGSNFLTWCYWKLIFLLMWKLNEMGNFWCSLKSQSISVLDIIKCLWFLMCKGKGLWNNGHFAT